MPWRFDDAHIGGDYTKHVIKIKPKHPNTERSDELPLQGFEPTGLIQAFAWLILGQIGRLPQLALFHLASLNIERLSCWL